VSTFSASLSSRCASASTAARTLGDFAVAGGDDTLRRLGRPHARILGRDLGGRFLQRLLIEGDRLVHQRRLDVLFAIDFQLAQIALAADAGFVEAAV
jgi:hypothetical protein